MPSPFRNKGKRWLPRHDAVVAAQYGTIPVKQIAQTLRRTPSAINTRAANLNLAKRQQPRPKASRWIELATAEAQRRVIDLDDVLGGARKGALARWYAFRTLRTEGASLHGIAAVTGFDHSTVHNGLRRIRDIEARAARLAVAA